ncbi:zinc-binding dehydrogenase [Nocardia brasiliensis]|uniref:Zinc-binding dehydrogenase n=1 Tax=Nocardia brasiliensis TaxID=37326 RepID=A0A6G9XQY3_NOCBR|nr:NADP-dependent oxidoreductase [Nocardia brasiliensis]QIS03327.1 zinc-binding dehydrogenase [Nocardia brasiliensis]
MDSVDGEPGNRQLVLRKRPGNTLRDSDFELLRGPVPPIGPGQALVRVHWLGIDPTQRGWLNDGDNYIDPVPLDTVMRGSGVGEIVASNTPDYPVGAWVAGMVGWQDYAVASGQGLFGLNIVPAGVDPKLMLSLFGVTGLSAYFGMVDVGRAGAGDTVVVSAAAGATGSVAGQIAKALGSKVIGIAGGARKCAWLREHAGFDHAIDYKREDVGKRLAATAPDGIDVFFDSVGGTILDHGLAHLAQRARVVLCGGIATGYTADTAAYALRDYSALMLKRARMEGFIVLDYADRFPEAFDKLSGWHSAGRIVVAEHVTEGLAAAPAALRGLFEGSNIGKQLVRVESR